MKSDSQKLGDKATGKDVSTSSQSFLAALRIEYWLPFNVFVQLGIDAQQGQERCRNGRQRDWQRRQQLS